MTLFPRLFLSIGLSFAALNSLIVPALAQPNNESNTVVIEKFERPTFEKHPLPDTLNTAQAWEKIGQNAFVAEDYRNSLAAYNKAAQLAISEPDPELLAERGWVHYRLGQYQRAAQDFDRAAMLYWQLGDIPQYVNVRQMKLFVELQTDHFDTLS